MAANQQDGLLNAFRRNHDFALRHASHTHYSESRYLPGDY
jgi:hypothetical protein